MIDIHDSIFHLRISEDGCNVRCKVKHVMVTFTLLNDLVTIFQPNHHHTLVLYPGVKSYEALSIALNSLTQELEHIKN